jgi:hypothetical protein
MLRCETCCGAVGPFRLAFPDVRAIRRQRDICGSGCILREGALSGA